MKKRLFVYHFLIKTSHFTETRKEESFSPDWLVVATSIASAVLGNSQTSILTLTHHLLGLLIFPMAIYI